jgi:hypothetical protein
MGVEDDDDEERHKKSKGKIIAKVRKKRGWVGLYKDELVAMIGTKKALVAEWKEEKSARWNELKTLEDKKWRSKLATGDREEDKAGGKVSK